MTVTLSQESIEQIVKVFKEASYPQDISKFFDRETATAIKKAYANANPDEAYSCERNGSKDPELAELARDALVKQDPGHAYSLAHEHPDEQLKTKARAELIAKYLPKSIEYIADLARTYSDKELAESVGWAYLQIDPFKAYHDGKQRKDEKLQEVAREKMISLGEQFVSIYNLAVDKEDAKLKEMTIAAMIQKNPLTALQFALRTRDNGFIGRALTAHIASSPLDGATKEQLTKAYLTSRLNIGQKKQDDEPDSIV